MNEPVEVPIPTVTGGGEWLSLSEAALAAGVHPARFYHAAVGRGHGPDMQRVNNAWILRRWAAEAVAAHLQTARGV